MINYDRCKIGCRVVVYDDISSTSTIAAISCVEYDEEYNIYWLYLINMDNPVCNNKFDPKFSYYYWDVIENCNPNIILASETDAII